MSVEWSTMTVGIVGIAATYFGSTSGRKQAERLAKGEHEHAVSMATEERRQTRLADAYTQALKIAERTGHWAQLVRPMMDTDPPRPVPPLPDLDEQAQAQVLLLAFGSSEAVAAFETWRQDVHRIIKADQLIGLQLQYGGVERDNEWPKLEQEYRPAERDSRRRLADVMATELGAADRQPLRAAGSPSDQTGTPTGQ